MKNAKSRSKTRLDEMIALLLNDIWQGWEAGNQTFTDEELEKVDVQEIRELLNTPENQE